MQAQQANGKPLVPRLQNRSKRTNSPRRMPVSANTKLGRRMRDLADDLAARAGGWSSFSPARAAEIRQAAELMALNELERERRLRGDPLAAGLEQLIRLDRLAYLAVKRLHLDDERPEPVRQSLREVLAEQQGEGSTSC